VKKLSEKYYIFILLIFLFIIFSVISYLSTGTYGGADDIVHYRFARYSFSHPQFFLNHWAKPVFTLLSSPFAQFGFFGIKIFNLIIGSLTAFLSYKIVKILNYKNAFLVIIFIFFR
jgi:ABC-type cobalt transport system substrate-binding protein